MKTNIEIYLDYTNNYLTVDKMSNDYGIPVTQLSALIDKGREEHEQKIKVRNWVLNEGLTLSDLIDVVIEVNGFIGVGLISLGDDLQKYVHNKIRKG